MHTENAIVIRATPPKVYELAAAVERWPELLPHYRWVRIAGVRGNRRLVEMAAHRDGFPVRWWAVQTRFPEVPRQTFRHVGGFTRGMDVEWRFEPTAAGVCVRVRHEWTLHWPVVGGIIAGRLVGPLFVEHIAGQTLRRLKELAEARDD